MLEHKRRRYLNRTDVINDHPYSVHFDVYTLQTFRLAMVLKFPSWFGNSILDPCAQKPCSANSICKPILNEEGRFYCSCKPGYTDMNCTVYEQKCSSYCSSDSICRPGQRGLIKNPDNPLCICSLDYFGPSCHIRNEACESDPCGLNGTCHLTYDPSGDKPIACQCSEQFYGDRFLRLGSAFIVYTQITTSDDHYWTAANHSLLS
ncbi:unnamed protein product [Adineta steineri]|uniref:EGF-like domain-containing protein n=1 Tax=Adineta steineri TaxID=433720 RepID=A0A819TKK1_9BILA|nr:unnamed protein product [Adineta steineri]